MWPQSRSSKAVWKCRFEPVCIRLMVWWSGPQRRNEKKSRHPVGFAKAEHVAIELGDVLDVGDMEGDVAELVRHDAFGLEFLVREGVALEHLHDGALGIGEHQHVGDRRLGVLAALGLDAVACDLLFEVVEIAIGRDLKADAHALRLRALAQHHRMVIDGRGEKDRVLFLGGERQSQESRCNIRSAARDRASRSWRARSC